MRGVDVYQDNNKESMGDHTVDEYYVLVKKIAFHIKKRLPSYIEVNDLIQSGFVGLLEAKNNFDESRGVDFKSFASLRIKGAMIDSLRKNSWGTKETMKNMRLLNEAISRLEQRGQRQPTAEEISKEMGISLEEHDKMMQSIVVSNVTNSDSYTDDMMTNGDIENPALINQKTQMIALIREQIEHLAEREQLILSLYYNEELTFKEISEILNLTEARISQLHTQAIGKIQAHLNA